MPPIRVGLLCRMLTCGGVRRRGCEFMGAICCRTEADEADICPRIKCRWLGGKTKLRAPWRGPAAPLSLYTPARPTAPVFAIFPPKQPRRTYARDRFRQQSSCRNDRPAEPTHCTLAFVSQMFERTTATWAREPRPRFNPRPADDHSERLRDDTRADW